MKNRDYCVYNLCFSEVIKVYGPSLKNNKSFYAYFLYNRKNAFYDFLNYLNIVGFFFFSIVTLN